MPSGVYERNPDNFVKFRGRTPWNKGKTNVYTEEQLRRISEGTKVAMQNPAVRRKISEGLLKVVKRGEESHRWVGDNITKKPVHKWVEKELGKPKECENCGDTSDRVYDWANLSGEYKRDVSDWARLCRVCHSAIDNYINKGWDTRRRNT
jgi:ATP-dependent helicase YprA (DUF1998 family)